MGVCLTLAWWWTNRIKVSLFNSFIRKNNKFGVRCAMSLLLDEWRISLLYLLPGIRYGKSKFTSHIQIFASGVTTAIIYNTHVLFLWCKSEFSFTSIIHGQSNFRTHAIMHWSEFKPAAQDICRAKNSSNSFQFFTSMHKKSSSKFLKGRYDRKTKTLSAQLMNRLNQVQG